MTYLERMLDRTLLWLTSAIRWAPGGYPPRDALFAALTDSSPILLVGEDAADSAIGRSTARFCARLLARTTPGFVSIVEGDVDLQRELDRLAAEPVERRQAGRAHGPVLTVGRAGNAGDVGIGTDSGMALVGAGRSFAATGVHNAAVALVAAALGTCEVTKHVLAPLLPQYAGRFTARDIEPIDEFTWTITTERRPIPDGVDLGAFYCVSAGALTQALVAVMLEQGCRGRGTLFDFDQLAVDNGNRYLLADALAMLRGDSKTEFIANLGFDRLVFVSDPRAYVAALRPAGVALVGADRVSARFEVAKNAPDVIINGASENNFIRVSTHNSDDGAACLACINPVDDPVEGPAAATISFVSATTGALMAARMFERAIAGAAESVVTEMQWLQPQRTGNLWTGGRARRDSCVHCRSHAA